MFEIAYLLSMVVVVVRGAEEIRENKDNDPNMDLVRHSSPHQILVIIALIGMSVFWPWFVFCYLLRKFGAGAAWLAARLSAKIERMEAAERAAAAAAAKGDRDA